jgi:hypothetical protein
VRFVSYFLSAAADDVDCLSECLGTAVILRRFLFFVFGVMFLILRAVELLPQFVPNVAA